MNLDSSKNGNYNILILRQLNDRHEGRIFLSKSTKVAQSLYKWLREASIRFNELLNLIR